MRQKRLLSQKLTDAEMKILNILWDNPKPMTSAEIREASVEQGIDGYVFNVLNRLLDKGVIKEVGKVQTYKKNSRLFYPAFTRDDYHHYYFESFCDHSIDNFLTGLVRSDDNSEDIVGQIKDWLDAYENRGE